MIGFTTQRIDCIDSITSSRIDAELHIQFSRALIQYIFIYRCREKAREKMMDLVQIMDSDTKKTAKVAKLKEWFVAREAQMAQLSLDGKLFLH